MNSISDSDLPLVAFATLSFVCFCLTSIKNIQWVDGLYTLFQSVLTVCMCIYATQYDMDESIILKIALIYYVQRFFVEGRKVKKDMLIHHIVSLSASLYCLFTPILIPFVPYIFLIYSTSIFLNIKDVLYVQGMKESILYTVNGGFLWLSFIIFRIIMLPFIIYNICIVAPLIHCIIAILSLGLIWLLSVYWFSIITKRLFSRLLKKNKN